MEILKGDFELNLNSIAEMNLRFEQLLMVNNRTEMECEDVRSALAQALSRHNLSATKVKFAEEMKREFFDLSVSNIRLGRPYLSEVSFVSTPADKIERVSLIRNSPVDQIEENSLISDSAGNGGPWLFGEEKNHSGLGLGCGGSDTSNTSALGQVEQLLMQRNEFKMQIINMRGRHMHVLINVCMYVFVPIEGKILFSCMYVCMYVCMNMITFILNVYLT
jgi:hypothetical protein